MVKRAQQAESTQQAKAPKIVDPMEKDFECVLGQLNKARGIVGASTVDMLQAVVPYCLGQGDRHDYQKSMVETVETTLKQIEESCVREVAASQSALADAEAKQGTATAELQSTEEKAKACEEDKATKDETQANSQAAVVEATQALQIAQESEQNLGAEKEAVLKDREESEKFRTTTWEAVKTGSFPGSEWRERNKAIEETIKMLDGFGLDASLKAALPTALKTKPADRKRFSLAAVEFAEAAISTRLQNLQAKIDNFEQEASARLQAVAAAKEALSAAEDKLQAAKADAGAAEEALQAVLSSKADIEKDIKAAPTLLAKLRKATEATQEELSQSQNALSHFLALKDRSPVA